jgi:hypothetical protein
MATSVIDHDKVINYFALSQMFLHEYLWWLFFLAFRVFAPRNRQAKSREKMADGDGGIKVINRSAGRKVKRPESELHIVYRALISVPLFAQPANYSKTVRPAIFTWLFTTFLGWRGRGVTTRMTHISHHRYQK